MKRPRARFVVAATLPFMVGCFGVIVQPIPEPLARGDTEVVGVVLDDDGEGERVEFSRVDNIQWTETSLSITGAMSRSNTVIETRTFAFTDVSGVLVRAFDGTRASIIVGGLFLTAIAIVTFVVNGDTNDGSRLPGSR